MLELVFALTYQTRLIQLFYLTWFWKMLLEKLNSLKFIYKYDRNIFSAKFDLMKITDKILIFTLISTTILASSCKSVKMLGGNQANANTEKAMLRALRWQEAHPIVEKSP